MSARPAFPLVALAAAATALAGCSSAHRDAPRRDDAPDPAACATAADCAPGPLVDPANVCCDTGVHLGVFSRAYLDWRARTVSAQCKPGACPALPPPTPPRACALEPRCADHRCTGSCEP